MFFFDFEFDLWPFIFCLFFLICFSSLSRTISIDEYMSFVSSFPLILSLSPTMLISAIWRNFSTESTTVAMAGLSRNLSNLSSLPEMYDFKFSEGSRFLKVTEVCIKNTSLKVFTFVGWKQMKHISVFGDCPSCNIYV